jgi:phenylacetate-CoA ligase
MYARAFRNVLFPLYETGLRGRETLRALDALERSQWRSPEAVAEASFLSLLEALRHAERHVPFYRRRFAEYGVRVDRVKAPEDLASFPVLTKDDIRSHGPELLAETHRGELHLAATGGSTGVPVRFVYDHRSYELRMASAIRSNRWAGADLGERELHLWGHAVGEAKRAEARKRALHTALLRQRFFSAFDLREERLDALVRELSSFAPRVLIGYTSALHVLARHVLAKGIALPPPRGVITSAERLYPDQRRDIERALGAPVFDRYGCRETMLIAAECERHEGLHVNAEGVYVELYRGGKPAPAGTAGEVLVSDLSNRAAPLLRYRNEDIAIAKGAACSCGRGLPLLGSVEGRVLDLIVGEGGRIVSGEVFPHLLKDFPVERFQVHQHKDRAVTLRIVPGPGFDAETATAIHRKLCLVLGDRADLSVELVREIPLTVSGKHRVTVSEVPVDIGTSEIDRGVRIAREEPRPARSLARARVAHVVLALQPGGLEQVVLALLARADRERFEPSVVALDEPGALAGRLAQMGVPLHVMPRAQGGGIDAALTVRLSAWLRREHIDIVHTHNPTPHLYGALAAALARRPTPPHGRPRPTVVHTKHGRNHPDDPRKVLANRLASALSDRIVAVSEDATRVAVEVEHVEAHRLVTIRNGVDTMLFHPDEPAPARRALGIPVMGFHVGCVARLSAEKDHATLLEAFARLHAARPDAHLTLIGDGPLRGELEAQRARLGLESALTLAGHREDVAALLPAFDVFALSSRTEGMSLTLLEAAAAALPIVATRVGGNPEVVADGETGILVPPGDPGRLSEALQAMAERQDRAAMGARGRARVAERHGMDRMAAAYDALYAEVLRVA